MSRLWDSLRLIGEYGTKGVRDTDTANTPETAR